MGEEEERIISDFLPFIRYTASRLSWRLPPYLGVEDLISAGITGFLDALRRYQEGRVKLRTFVQFRIKGAMLDELRAQNWIPKSMGRKINAIKAAHNNLEKELGRPPEGTEVAAFLGITPEEYFDALRIAAVRIHSFGELDGRESGGNRPDITECLSDPEAKGPFEVLEDKETREIIARLVDRLPEREKLILSLYYWEEMTMKEIARVIKLTEGRICQLHNQALMRLRAQLHPRRAVSEEVNNEPAFCRY